MLKGEDATLLHALNAVGVLYRLVRVWQEVSGHAWPVWRNAGLCLGCPSGCPLPCMSVHSV